MNNSTIKILWSGLKDKLPKLTDNGENIADGTNWGQNCLSWDLSKDFDKNN